MEAGDFDVLEETYKYKQARWVGWSSVKEEHDAFHDGYFATVEEAWDECLATMRSQVEVEQDDYDVEYHGPRPIMINILVSGERKEEFKPLRDLLKKQDDATLIHKWTNPNTLNDIECWFLTNYSE